MVNNKKAISPVVATALLLVVAVVAVVGFQTWFNTYQSTLNVKVEEQSQGGSAITIERLEAVNNGTAANATVYLRNRDTANDITVTEWKITKDGTTYCTDSTGGTALANVVTAFNITDSSCNALLVTDASVDVAVITSTGVYSARQIVR